MSTYHRKDNGFEVEAVEAKSYGWLTTPDGEATYLPGDFIVTLPNGDQFVCKAPMFKFKYALSQPPGNK